jgi:uncharacterized protein with GYD domain
MTKFVLLSKVAPSAIDQTAKLSDMDEIFTQELSQRLPEVTRIASYALLGNYDFMHIIEAPDELSAAKVALLVNHFGAAATQTLTAIPFAEFKQVTEDIKRIKVAMR